MYIYIYYMYQLTIYYIYITYNLYDNIVIKPGVDRIWDVLKHIPMFVSCVLQTHANSIFCLLQDGDIM
jgi:hypothetical protein